MEKFIYWKGTFVSDNIINLDSYRNSYEVFDNSEITDLEDLEDLEDVVVIGWRLDEEGEKCLNISSSVNTVSCLWMIDLARKIVESRPPECRNENE